MSAAKNLARLAEIPRRSPYPPSEAAEARWAMRLGLTGKRLTVHFIAGKIAALYASKRPRRSLYAPIV